MERLTERDEFGNADIIGVDSADLQLNLTYPQFNRVTTELNRLANYEDADEQGLLVRLPCKVGAEVCRIETGCCIEREMDRCSAYCDGFDYQCADYKAERTIAKSRFTLSDIPFMGEIVFIERSEAESALAKDINAPDKEEKHDGT